MSATAADSSAGPLADAELSLTGVEVAFLAERPQSKLRLVVKVDGKDREIVINEGKPVRWTGTLRFRTDAKVVIHIHRRNRAHMWSKFASASATLSAKSSPFTDEKQQIRVSLTVHEPKTHDPQVSTTMTGVTAAKKELEKKIPIVEKLKPILRVLEVLAKIGESLKDINPAIGSAVGAVNALIEVCKMQETCREEALNIVDELASFLSIERHIEVLKKRAETRRALNVMLDLISESTDFIREKTATGFIGLVDDLLGTKYREKIDKVKKEFARAKEAFDRSVQLEIFVAIDGTERTTEFTFLHDNLSDCKNAHFSPGDDCLDGTRADLRLRIEQWIDNDDEGQPNLFWLYGNAGSGKSTVANTVAKMVEGSGRHLSCFFCKRDDSNLSSPVRLFPTLAYRFAEQHPSYRAAIMKLLPTPRGAGIATTADLKTQFQRLFEELLAQTVDPLRQHVVVIDALDECGSPGDQKQLATQILALSRAVPWIKVVLTSRNEPEIRDIFFHDTGCISRNINEETGVEGDIRLYIESRALELKLPLSHADIEELRKQADGLFIWCKTLFEYLRDGIGAKYFLKQLLAGKGHQTSQPWSQLYKLYAEILDSVLGPQASDAVAFMRALLSVINIAASTQPLSAKAVTSFVLGVEVHKHYDAEDTEKIVKKLHAVLYADGAANGALRAHHISFYDFLAWKASASTESGWAPSGAVHRLMAQRCLETLHKELKFNICEIDTPVLNKHIPDLAERISTHISEILQYSCRYWFIHFIHSALTEAEVKAAVLELLHSVKLLYWLECASLLGFLRQLRFTFRVCIQKFFQTCPAIVAAAEDACRFITSFADAMDSVPHIYLSALLWLPEDSLTYKNMRLSARTNWHLIENKRKNWDPLVWSSDQNGAGSIAFSPDGRLVAYSTRDGDVHIRDSQTGALEGEPVRGHGQTIYSLAYSPDARFLASGSGDGTVRVWDVKTGETIFPPLEGHFSWVLCVAFSPDGLFVASGSNDGTVRIWNAWTGKSEGDLLQHPHWVRAVAYSPDGRFIASACDDGCVHVWDTSSREEAMKPLQGHQHSVLSVAYSPDGCTIVSGAADKTIRVWNAHTGEAMGQPLRGHAQTVTSVAYSPDGRFILSGSYDKTVRLWDAASGDPIDNPLPIPTNCLSYSPDGSLIASASDDGVCVWDSSTCFVAGSTFQDRAVQADTRTPAVYAIAYSPDGRFVASVSQDNQIRIWNAQTGASVDRPVLRHLGQREFGSVAYSPDGQRIVSSSFGEGDSNVCILDVQTGAIISGPLRGHSESIESVAYSPDGRVVASASWDATVRLWDVHTSAAIGEPLEVGSPALSVAFSLDGDLLACGTSAGSIYVWDGHTRMPLGDPIQAHSDAVRSVAFSPNGNHIASRSDDRSVKIWDIQTGKASGSPLQEHDRYVICVAYSPDGRSIASSSYGEIIIWDTQSGTAYETLRGPSTDISSVAYSPDGHFLASGAWNGKIYIHDLSNEPDDTEACWISGCSQMDMDDGWVKDGDTLLLWVPVPYRGDIRFCARLIISNHASNIRAHDVDYRTLFRYSGRNWTDIFSGFVP